MTLFIVMACAVTMRWIESRIVPMPETMQPIPPSTVNIARSRRVGRNGFVACVPAGAPAGLPYRHPMSIVGQFIAALQQEQRIGNVSAETEQHLKHEFRKLGGARAANNVLAAALDAEIDRLERQAATLRRLRDDLLGEG